MLKLEEISVGARIKGIVPDEVVKVIATEKVSDDSITVTFRRDSGGVDERMLSRDAEAGLAAADGALRWSFDADGDAFKLALEAQRIQWAHLFDPMMAVHSSRIEPLPHQISAVYEHMLPRIPLRFLLADDPGAGKTIMAGLLIRELIMRSSAHRILIVAPGGLVPQWQDELSEKFDLPFRIFERTMLDASITGNPFSEHARMIVRLDQIARSDELRSKLEKARWDLVVVDEAHKMSAYWYGRELKRTKRYQLGQLLRDCSRHFLLMTATPHNGKEEDFRLFLALLDKDRFRGKSSEQLDRADVSDLMRRMIKEELVKFDGARLFPKRYAHTVTYTLSSAEKELYDAVTDYVRHEMNKADSLGGSRKGSVGFALTILQRRLASSPEAIYKSLKRRRKRLETRVEERRREQRGEHAAETLAPYVARSFDAMKLPVTATTEEDLTAEELEMFSDDLVEQASAAKTIEELESEIETLQELERSAWSVVQSKQDSKWKQMSSLLQENALIKREDGWPRKLIVFTEHRDTVNYLCANIRGVLGSHDAVTEIHGGLSREKKRAVEAEFMNNPDVLVLVATDAAGEGLNLQRAHLMINYDLPWNPNRIEQRFGRIHRIGQDRECHLWNLVAEGTREGKVFKRLLEKLEIEREDLGGRVFDVLGDVFEERSLKDLLIDAIRRGDDPKTREMVEKEVDRAFDPDRLREIIERNALSRDILTSERLYAVKEEMEKAEARKLQPHFLKSFFKRALQEWNGELRRREEGRYEIPHVAQDLRHREEMSPGRKSVSRRYERVCFERDKVELYRKPRADLLHPGHPLMAAVIDGVLERHRRGLDRGATLVAESDDSTEPYVLLAVDHSVQEPPPPASNYQPITVSRRLRFLTFDVDGKVTDAGWAPHLDLRPLNEREYEAVAEDLGTEWLDRDLEQKVLSFAGGKLAKEHFEEIRNRRFGELDKVLHAVHTRLTSEINRLSKRYLELNEQVRQGKQPRMQPENIKRSVEELRSRLRRRKKEIKRRKDLVSRRPVIRAGALVIPGGLLATRLRDPALSPDECDVMQATPTKTVTPAAPESRDHVEALAMEAVTAAEHKLGYKTKDVSKENCGWDITSEAEGKPDRHIEVKGRAKGQTTVAISRNEILYALNQADKFILAIVLVDEDDSTEGPFYIRKPFQKEPDWHITSINYDLNKLLERAERVQ
jgi:ERCC4-related helicase